ncbi:MAG: hypothetical protein HY063_05725 [Bacteroidetes bacterium]|nr:hypothetical protein [Bacteroidota bacterium]
MKSKGNTPVPIPETKNNFFNKIFPEAGNKNALYLFLILIFYSAIVLLGISRHEMWRDEIEPWLIGSFSQSLSDFFHNMKMGSNPYIWYLILHFLSKISLNPVIVQIAHTCIAIGSVYIFLRYAPFNLLQKLLFCAGYYIVYEYGIISRGYSLTIFFLFLFCALYRKYWNVNIPLAIVIFFLANATGGFGAILSISLLIFILANYYFDEMQDGKKKIKIKYTGWAVAIILFSIWVAMKSISPPPDSVYNTEWYVSVDFNRAFEILRRVWSGFIPIPDLSEVHFWNSNFINKGDIGTGTKNFLTVCSLVFLIYSVLLFSKKTTVLLFYTAGTFGILFFSYLNPSIFYINGTRYHGFLFIVFIISFWLLKYFPEKKKVTIPLLTKWNEQMNIQKYQNQVMAFFLSVNVFAAGVAFCKDFVNDFSSVERTGKFIVEKNLQRFSAAGFIDYAISPISAFTRKPFYYPERDTTSTFPIWTKKNYTTDINQAMNRMLSRISKINDTTLVVLNFDLNTSMIGDIYFSHLADFKGSIVADENFSVFLAHKFDLNRDLANDTPLTDGRMMNYISLANGLLQQNKLDDCEKVLAKIESNATEKPYNGFHNCRGLLFMKKNNLDQAKREFQKEIDLNLKNDEAYFQLGMIFYQQLKSDSAMWAWEKTIELNPNNLDAYSDLGICYLNFKKDMNKAEELWNKTIQLNPNFVQGYLNLMILCQNKKDENCLLNNLKIVLKKGVSPNDIRARGINLTDDLLKKATS